VDVLVDAFASIAASQPASDGTPVPHLVLVGETTGEVFHSGYAALREQVHRLGLERHVTFTGYLPDADLVGLYQVAACFVLPSRDEGFGLPVVEAMACGAPVIASRADALTEVVGEAGLLVESGRPDQLAEALTRLLSDESLRAGLRERGFRRASQFSWQRAAAELLDVFAELGPRRPGRAERPPRIRASHG
jgi:glycosyltransferase involved in cell wall biosynthesis